MHVIDSSSYKEYQGVRKYHERWNNIHVLDFSVCDILETTGWGGGVYGDSGYIEGRDARMGE